MAEVDRYLLPSERVVAVARRHWAVLLPQFVPLALVWLVWLLLLRVSPSDYLATAALCFFLISLLWVAWLVGDWLVEQFAVTDKRVLLVSGLLTKRVAVMPLRKVTDLTYERTPAGRVLGYGTFVMESAGQDQALSRIDYLSQPDVLYQRMSRQLFGPKGGRPADHGVDPDDLDLVDPALVDPALVDPALGDPDDGDWSPTRRVETLDTARLPRL